MKIHTIHFDRPSGRYMQMLSEMIRSAKNYMPEVEVVVHSTFAPERTVTDSVDGNLVKLQKQQKIIWQETEPFIFADCDLKFFGDITDVFEDDFDIAFTERTNRATAPPLNVGIVFVRPSDGVRKFYDEWLKSAEWLINHTTVLNHYLTRYKGICQAALARVSEQRFPIKIELYPCSVYNACIEDWKKGIQDVSRVVHLNSQEAKKSIYQKEPVYPHLKEVWYGKK